MEKPVVVFGTTAIVCEAPAYPGQAPKYVNACPKHGYASYSTGKLEAAIALGYDIYVCSVIPLFRPEDAWWRELVPVERIYRPISDAMGTREQAFDHFIVDPWRRLLRDLGRSLPSDVKDPLEWRMTLDGSDGLLYGGRLQGHSGIAA